MKPTSTYSGVVFLLATLALRLAANEPDLSEKLLGITDEARIQLVEAEQRGLIEIAPVSLPVDPPGDCNHYGCGRSHRRGFEVTYPFQDKSHETHHQLV